MSDKTASKSKSKSKSKEKDTKEKSKDKKEEKPKKDKSSTKVAKEKKSSKSVLKEDKDLELEDAMSMNNLSINNNQQGIYNQQLNQNNQNYPTHPYSTNYNMNNNQNHQMYNTQTNLNPPSTYRNNPYQNNNTFPQVDKCDGCFENDGTCFCVNCEKIFCKLCEDQIHIIPSNKLHER